MDRTLLKKYLHRAITATNEQEALDSLREVRQMVGTCTDQEDLQDLIETPAIRTYNAIMQILVGTISFFLVLLLGLSLL